jgi:hypothetical protein
MSQQSVAYQDSPKGDQQCNNCSLFQAPNGCTLVDGNISRWAGVNSGSKRPAERSLLLTAGSHRRRSTPWLNRAGRSKGHFRERSRLRTSKRCNNTFQALINISRRYGPATQHNGSRQALTGFRAVVIKRPSTVIIAIDGLLVIDSPSSKGAHLVRAGLLLR